MALPNQCCCRAASCQWTGTTLRRIASWGATRLARLVEPDAISVLYPARPTNPSRPWRFCAACGIGCPGDAGLCLIDACTVHATIGGRACNGGLEHDGIAKVGGEAIWSR